MDTTGLHEYEQEGCGCLSIKGLISGIPYPEKLTVVFRVAGRSCGGGTPSSAAPGGASRGERLGERSQARQRGKRHHCVSCKSAPVCATSLCKLESMGCLLNRLCNTKWKDVQILSCALIFSIFQFWMCFSFTWIS